MIAIAAGEDRIYAFKIDTADDLLHRAAWLCAQVMRLHEISYDLGATSAIADASALPAHCLTGQRILDFAAYLGEDIRIHHLQKTNQPQETL